jgi:predicted house-cleaning NTP pyrophosphatase (Maf/HAM1 superfamily)
VLRQQLMQAEQGANEVLAQLRNDKEKLLTSIKVLHFQLSTYAHLTETNIPMHSISFSIRHIRSR